MKKTSEKKTKTLQTNKFRSNNNHDCSHGKLRKHDQTLSVLSAIGTKKFDRPKGCYFCTSDKVAQAAVNNFMVLMCT